MYIPRNRIIYRTKSFGVPASAAAHEIMIDVTAYGYPREATAVDLIVGCRSRGDGAYVAAYDRTTGSLGNAAVYPTAPLRYDWNFGRGRVQLDRSRFLLRVRPVGHPVDVITTLKGYYALE